MQSGLSAPAWMETKGQMMKRLWSAWTHFLDGIQRMDVGPLQLSAILLCVLFVRIVLEWSLEAQKAFEPPASLFLFLAYFASVLAGIFLILWRLSGRPPIVAAKVLAVFSPLLWLPPLWDFVASGGRGYVLQFVFSPPDYWTAFFNACTGCAGVSDGLRVEVVLAALAAFGFVRWASGRWWKAALASLTVYAFILLQALWPAYLMGFLAHPNPDVFFMRELLSSYALLVCAALLWAWHASGATMGIRIERLLHYVGLALFGAVAGFSQWMHGFPGVLLPLSAMAVSVAAAFQAAVCINDWADRHMDARGTRRFDARSRFPLSSMLGWTGVAVFSGMAAGYGVFLTVAFALALSIAYSAEPIRLRRHVVLASAVLAACSLAVVAAGFSVGLFGPETVPNAMPPALGLLVLGFVFLAAPFKDLKDDAGDRKGGVFSFATWLGVPLARKVSAVLVLAAVLWATALSGASWFLGLAFGLAAAASVLFIPDLQRMERVVFGLDYVFLALLAAHMAGWLVLA